jgi:hypothetical protein
MEPIDKGGLMEASTDSILTRAPARAGSTVRKLFAGVAGMIGLALLLGGVAGVAGYAFERDDDGFVNSDRQQLESGAYAITTEDIDLGVGELDWAPDGVLGEVRVQVDAERPVFVGIARDEDVQRYLGAVERDELIAFDGRDSRFDPHQGRAPGTPPGEQGFWVAQSEGTGEQALTWDADFGRWTAVVMNADGARGIDVEADAGVKLDWAIWAALGMLAVGLVLSAGAVSVLARSRGRAA